MGVRPGANPDGYDVPSAPSRRMVMSHARLDLPFRHPLGDRIERLDHGLLSDPSRWRVAGRFRHLVSSTSSGSLVAAIPATAKLLGDQPKMESRRYFPDIHPIAIHSATFPQFPLGLNQKSWSVTGHNSMGTGAVQTGWDVDVPDTGTCEQIDLNWIHPHKPAGSHQPTQSPAK